MISLKNAVFIFAFGSYDAIAASLSSPPIHVDGLPLSRESRHKHDHWEIVKPSLDEMFPGITCNIYGSNSTIRSLPNLVTSSLENTLIDIHPSITCTGELDETAFLKGYHTASHALEKRRDVPMCKPCCCKDCPNQEYHKAQAAAPHPYVKTSQEVQLETKAQNAVGIAETKSGYVSCDHANHPDACKACWTGFAAQLASELGGCSLAAYAAFVKLKAGYDRLGIWAIYLCCVGACTGKFVALSSGCIGR